MVICIALTKNLLNMKFEKRKAFNKKEISIIYPST